MAFNFQKRTHQTTPTPFTNYNCEFMPFTLLTINNVCAKCINSFPSVEETISLRGNKKGRPEAWVEGAGDAGGRREADEEEGSISLMGNEGH